MVKHVITATAIAVSVLGLGAWDEAAALMPERLTDGPKIDPGSGGGPYPGAPATPAPAAGALIIVAAGDSFASGEGAADHSGLIPYAFWGGTNNDFAAVRCHRSTLAGAANAAGRLGAFTPVGFFNFACSGATTASIPGQLSTIATELGRLGLGGSTAPIDALVLSIGGNDLGFGGIVASCMIPGVTCDFTGLPADLAALPALLDGAFTRVNSGAAGTIRHVLVTEYPDPTSGPAGLRCGNPFVPAFEGFEGIDELEAGWASVGVVAPLNAALSAAVGRANAAPGTHPVWHFVSDISTRFQSHGYCTGVGSPVPVWLLSPRYINTPVDSYSGQADYRGIMHPNDLGYSEIGDVVATAIVSAMTPPPAAPTDTAPTGPVERVCHNKSWTTGCEWAD